jgi:hypothetical protein
MKLIRLTQIVPLLAIPLAFAAAAETEKIRNPHAIVTEDVLAPGESRSIRGDLPSVTVYCQAGSVNSAAVKQGEAAFLPSQAYTLKNTGTSPIRIVHVEFPGKGSDDTWGLTGIPHYKLLLENRYARVYNIQVAAGSVEPLHTHKDRVVICLSGAELVHTFPDGREEPATLKSGQIDWRLGATHIGHNIGKTDLWVVAIEPK